MKVKIKKVLSRAKLPAYAMPGDAGMEVATAYKNPTISTEIG